MAENQILAAGIGLRGGSVPSISPIRMTWAGLFNSKDETFSRTAKANQGEISPESATATETRSTSNFKQYHSALLDEQTVIEVGATSTLIAVDPRWWLLR